MKILFRWLLMGVLVFGFVGCGGGGTTPQKDETNSPTSTETNSSSETNSTESAKPIFTSEANVSVSENQTDAITLVATDVDSPTLAYSISGTDYTSFDINSTTGVVTFNTAPNYEVKNSYSFIATASDGVNEINQSVTITITDVNDAPTATVQDVTIDEDSSNNAITLAGTDADGNTLTYTVATSPSHGTLSGTAPNLTYTPTANYNGDDSFTFKVNDGTVDSSSATVDIIVNSVNDLPTANAGTDKNITLGESVDINGTATDIDGTVDTYVWSLDTNPSYEAFTQDITVTGLAEGNHTFTLTVSDNENGIGTATVKVIVTPFTITHHGVTYGTVTSPYTGKVWLDRNLGASQVCTALDDPLCYGDYYQWGRNTDGHEKSTSTTTTTQATDINSSGNAFITDASITYNYDWAYNADPSGSLRSVNWSKTDGSSVCPVGFRVPTIAELSAELLDSGSAEILDNTEAFNSFLKLPSSGYRSIDFASMLDVGSWVNVWSSSASGAYSPVLYFDSVFAIWYSDGNRALGLSVRCLRD